MDAVGEEEGYKPQADFEENAKEPLVDFNMTDSTELWLIQWPKNQVCCFFLWGSFFLILNNVVLLLLVGSMLFHLGTLLDWPNIC